MKKIWTLFSIFLIIVCNGEVFKRKRICVIGAGRAGLAAVKLVAEQSGTFELVAVERNSDVGGLWIYRDDPYKDEHGLDAHSGIYKHLRTNLPIVDMIYQDYPNFEGKENETTSHQQFLQYMRNYTDYFHLRQYIQFDTLVTKVIPVNGNGDWTTTTWLMEMRNLNTGKENSTTCHAVMLCNGHFSKAYMPEIAGLKETFPGRVLHSRNYRVPEAFINKTVVVLGARNSGIDIAIDLGNFTKKTYLSHRHNSISDRRKLPKNVEVVRGVVAANGDKITLQDDSTIVADTFIFCTGYEYDFPFLDQRSGIVYDREHVHWLYDFFINVEHPSMAFIGLVALYDYGSLYYDQTIYFLKLLQGKEKLPSYEEMLKDAIEWEFLSS